MPPGFGGLPDPQSPEDGEPDTPAEVPAEDSPPQDQPAAKAIEAFKPVLLDAAARVVRKESAAVDRSRIKYKSNTEAYVLWAESFFNDEHVGYIVDTFQPSVHALCCIIDRTWNAEFKSIKEHVCKAKTTAIDKFKCIDAGGPDNRATELAESLIQEICNG
jgi:hypothetical protein